jgi:hypothetical protein
MFAMSDGFDGVVLQPVTDTNNVEASSKGVRPVKRTLGPFRMS